MTNLLKPLSLRDMTVKNRMWLAPMCTYQAKDLDGKLQPFHQVHYGARALGGFGLLTTESVAVAPQGRLSAKDLGLWADDQMAGWAEVIDFAHGYDVKVAMQINHAGRKASTIAPIPGEKTFETRTVPASHGGWETEAPSPLAAFDMLSPREMSREEIYDIPELFAATAQRAVETGVDAIEIHAAHGYLIHQFLSPISNKRSDSWGGSFDNRTRLVRLITTAVRATVGDSIPLIVRLSATDWVDYGPSWDLDQTISLAKLLKNSGVDLVSVTSAGLTPATGPIAPNYHVPLSREIRSKANLPTGVAGLITTGAQAEGVLVEGAADVVYIGRAALREPHWPLRATSELGVANENLDFAGPYVRGWLES